MKQGFIKVRAFTPLSRVADVKYNTAKIIQAIWDSAERGAKILVFPELCVSSATCGDLFLQRPFLDACENAVSDIANATYEKNIAVVVGAPLRLGNCLYNCAVVLFDGKILGVVPKTTLTTDEKRYFFAPSGEEKCISINQNSYPFSQKLVFADAGISELKLGIEFGDDLFSASTMAHELCAKGATVIACPSAMPEVVYLEEKRLDMAKAKSRALKCAYIVSSAGECESTTDAIYGSHNIICENGTLLAQCEPFPQNEGDAISEVDVSFLCDERVRSANYPTASDKELFVPFRLEVSKTELTRFIDPSPFVSQNIDNYEKILTMQSLALARRLSASGSKTAVLGISGGLDSTLALLVLIRACDFIGWDRTAVHCITMPCFGTTKRTKSNAIKLCECLGVTLKEIDISNAVSVHFEDIGLDKNDRSVAFENAQARERTQILMDYANTVGALVVGTGDLSEIALGWSTYNADHMSMYNPNCDIPKTLVRELVFYETGEAPLEVGEVLSDILATPVSPELLPPDKDGKIAQKTEDLVGPYELHDFFLYNFIRKGFAPSKIYRIAKYAFEGKFDDETIYKWLCVFIKRFFTQQFKRSCSPDGVRVGSVALSPRAGLKMPSDATYWVWLDELNNNKD